MHVVGPYEYMLWPEWIKPKPKHIHRDMNAGKLVISQTRVYPHRKQSNYSYAGDKLFTSPHSLISGTPYIVTSSLVSLFPADTNKPNERLIL